MSGIPTALISKSSRCLHKSLRIPQIFRLCSLSAARMEVLASLLLQQLVRIVFDKVTSLLLEEYGLLRGIKGDLEKLRSTLTAIQAVLEDAEAQQTMNRSVRDWLEKLKDMAEDAEDVLDDFQTEVLRRRPGARYRLMKKVRDFFSRYNQLAYSYKVAHEMKKIRERSDSIAAEVSRFQFRQGAIERHPGIEDRRQTHSFVITSEVLGRDDDRRNIVTLLRGNPSDTLLVIAIVGMGGLGKTTLAQLVWNDDDLKDHFSLRIWICVADDFDLVKLLKSILELATGEQCQIIDLEFLQQNVRRRLVGERFLLVLDDVWNEEQEKWESLEKLLRCGAAGSRVIVTTRSTKVSSIVSSVDPYNLRPLSDDHCWSLFRLRAFDVDKEEYRNLEAMGKEIVKKCGGVPLAAKALGSLMRFKREESDWLSVMESETWELSENEYGILPALKLSYDHLPSQSKRCFAFCSIFPKDHDIEKENLIRLWLANGFISFEERMEPERVGDRVFHDLLWRSFFQDEKKDAVGHITHCKMHDLIHDLAQSVAGNECSILASDKVESFPKRIHHVSITPVSLSTSRSSLYKTQSLRTFLLLNAPWTDLKLPPPDDLKVLNSIFSKLKFLRVLDLSRSSVKELPKSIGTMKHLRYLNLSSTSIKRLPNSTSYLLNLQTLKLNRSHIGELPRGLRNMQALRHLDIRSCQNLTHMPIGLGQLTALQTLTDFIVGRETGCSIRELSGLKLCGELLIWNLENVKDEIHAKQAILGDKQNLRSLRLSWKDIGSSPNSYVENLLEELRPHDHLKRLQLHNYGGVNFPTWMEKSLLPNLVEVKLVNCRRCEHLPPFGQLQHLKDLQIIGMEVPRIESEFYGSRQDRYFPSLKQLSFYDMPNLEEWLVLDGFEIFPCLLSLTIGSCPRLQTFPRLPQIQRLDLWNSNAMLLSSVTNLSSLTSLVVAKIPGLASPPEMSLENLTSLRKLTIADCNELRSLPREEMQHLRALQQLDIAGCKELLSIALDGQQLTALQHLSVRNCINLVSLQDGPNKFSSLQSLKVVGCRKMTSWSEEDMQGLSSLREYQIEVCMTSWSEEDMQGLSSLNEDQIEVCNHPSAWLQHLTTLRMLTMHGGHALGHLPDELSAATSLKVCCCGDLGSMEGLVYARMLEDLAIHGFPDLVALPEWIGELTLLRDLSIRDCPSLASLPEGIIRLTALQVLLIQGCPQLESRCQREGGEDWNKISHVRRIQIA